MGKMRCRDGFSGTALCFCLDYCSIRAKDTLTEQGMVMSVDEKHTGILSPIVLGTVGGVSTCLSEMDAVEISCRSNAFIYT